MIVFLINLASTWFMIGLIWIIQIVHYPLFSAVGTEEFKTFHLTHKILISPLAGSLMLFEFSNQSKITKKINGNEVHLT